MGGARAAAALAAAGRCPGSSSRRQPAAKISAAARAVMPVNTAKQKWPIMLMGSQQSAGDASTEAGIDLASTGLSAGWESACPVFVAFATAIGGWCAVWAWARWCMPTRPNAMATISNH